VNAGEEEEGGEEEEEEAVEREIEIKYR
jgi:hypothetical protein